MGVTWLVVACGRVGIGTGKVVYFCVIGFLGVNEGGVRRGELELKQPPLARWDVAVIRMDSMDEAAVSCSLGSCMPRMTGSRTGLLYFEFAPQPQC